MGGESCEYASSLQKHCSSFGRSTEMWHWGKDTVLITSVLPKVWLSKACCEEKTRKSFWNTKCSLCTSVHVWHVPSVSCAPLRRRAALEAEIASGASVGEAEFGIGSAVCQRYDLSLDLDTSQRPYSIYSSKDATYKCICFFQKRENAARWFPKCLATRRFGCIRCI